MTSCKYCGSTNVTKGGFYRHSQRYWCKNCRRKFRPDDHLFHMRVPREYVSRTLDMYYNGVSVREIRNILKQDYGYYPSRSTLHQWIDKYTAKALIIFRNYHPHSDDTWIAQERKLKLNKRDLWVYDAIDEKSLFFLATRSTYTRTARDIDIMMRVAVGKTNKNPRTIMVSMNYSHFKIMRPTFLCHAVHISNEKFETKSNRYTVPSFDNIYLTRKKVIRRLRTLPTARRFFAGWLIHYNYLQTHPDLSGQTPAEAASVNYPIKSWAALVNLTSQRK